MSQADTNEFAQAPIHNDPGLAHEGLAGFAALADPDSIAGGGGHARQADGERDEVVARLNAELQRRAKQIEDLSTGLAKPKPNSIDADELTSVRQEVTALKQQLDASNSAAREAHEQLAERDVALETSRRDQNQLRRTLERMQREFEDYASERTRVRELSTDLSNRNTSLQMLTEERDGLRGTVASIRKDVDQANQEYRHTKELLAETRERLVARETDANALRGALVANQKQAQSRDCEINELKTALSIASETLASRRAELSTLRSVHADAIEQLDQANERGLSLTQSLESDRAALHERVNELQSRTDQISRMQRELDERKAEITRLREQRDHRNRENETLRVRLEQAEETSESIARELDHERNQLTTERERATLREQTLGALHETLASIGKAVSSAPSVEADAAPQGVAPEPESEPRIVDPPDETLLPQAVQTQTADHDEDAEFDATPEAILEADPAEAHAEEAEFEALSSLVATSGESGSAIESLPPLVNLVPRRGQRQRPAIFRDWRDQQIAKHLAPLGVTCATDYFARCIDPILEANPGKVIDLLSLGGDDFEFELRIAQNLRRRGHDAFRIHYPELELEQAAEMNHKAGLVGIDLELVPYMPGGAVQMEVTDFRAIMSDGALSRSEKIEPLIEVLRDAVARKTVLVVGESTGLVPNEVAKEMGDRIWQLMPERYKTNTLTGLPESHYWNTNVTAPMHPDLLALLRAHFKLEDYAAFGHLIDRFVGLEFGPNFDPDDERDRRFIDQIASLDATKLDAGAMEPLHLITRLTAR